MRINKEARKISRQLFKSSFTDGRLDEAKVRALVASILEERPRHFLAVLKEYHRLLRLETARHHALIESAEPVSAADSARLLRLLRAKRGSQVTAEFAVNRSLIGGLRVRLGADVWDGTVRGRLDRLQEQFNLS